MAEHRALEFKGMVSAGDRFGSCQHKGDDDINHKNRGDHPGMMNLAKDTSFSHEHQS